MLFTSAVSVVEIRHPNIQGKNRRQTDEREFRRESAAQRPMSQMLKIKFPAENASAVCIFQCGIEGPFSTSTIARD
jgi:hypothetical protein